MAIECSVCGSSSDKVTLVEAVSMGKGIVKICESCANRENMPILRRNLSSPNSESQKPSFVKKSPEKPEFFSPEREVSQRKLKEIVDRNYERLTPKERKPRPDLEEHFHWLIMRARRRKKLTQEQLAAELSEPIAAIKMAENGILPDSDYVLVTKLERFLEVQLIKDRQKAQYTQNVQDPSRVLKFDSHTTKSLTVDNLRRMRREEAKQSEKIEEPSFDDEDFPSVFHEED